MDGEIFETNCLNCKEMRIDGGKEGPYCYTLTYKNCIDLCKIEIRIKDDNWKHYNGHLYYNKVTDLFGDKKVYIFGTSYWASHVNDDKAIQDEFRLCWQNRFINDKETLYKIIQNKHDEIDCKREKLKKEVVSFFISGKTPPSEVVKESDEDIIVLLKIFNKIKEGSAEDIRIHTVQYNSKVLEKVLDLNYKHIDIVQYFINIQDEYKRAKENNNKKWKIISVIASFCSGGFGFILGKLWD